MFWKVKILGVFRYTYDYLLFAFTLPAAVISKIGFGQNQLLKSLICVSLYCTLPVEYVWTVRMSHIYLTIMEPGTLISAAFRQATFILWYSIRLTTKKYQNKAWKNTHLLSLKRTRLCQHLIYGTVTRGLRSENVKYSVGGFPVDAIHI
jgi:hypothetical protein